MDIMGYMLVVTLHCRVSLHFTNIAVGQANIAVYQANIVVYMC